MRKRSITAIIPGNERLPGACEIYRVTQPLYYAYRRGWETRWVYAETLRNEGWEFLLSLVVNTDVFVIPRASAVDESEFLALESLVSSLRMAGAKVIYEVDDDYTNDHRKVHDGDAMAVAMLCDAVTVTTPYLGELMTRKTGRPHYVLPNMLDPKLWRDSEEPERLNKKKVTIGLTGSPTHERDWRIMEYVLPEIAERSDVSILIGGYHPDYLAGLPNTQYIPPVNYTVYSQVIRACDIVLAPVDPTDQFNMGKSPIKAVEGMGAARTIKGGQAGACVIATDHPVYELAIRHDFDGLLVPHDAQYWLDAIHEMIGNVPKRHKIQRRAYKTAWKHFDITEGAKQWMDVYEDVLKLPEM